MRLLWLPFLGLTAIAAIAIGLDAMGIAAAASQLAIGLGYAILVGIFE